MRSILNCCASGLVFVLVASCAQESASRRGGADTVSSPADSIRAAARDALFVEKHASVIRELAERERGNTPDIGFVEAGSLVSASEELYLTGMLEAAIALLDEAELLIQ
jgi:hypothetical protein